MSVAYGSDPSVSIVIISFNTAKLLSKCIDSVINSFGHIFFELIIVDNASSDGSVEAVEALEDARISIIKNSENLGFAAANNQAFHTAQGKYVLLLNSDALVEGGSLETLITFMDDHPRAAAAGPKILNVDGTLQNKGFCFPSIAGAMLFLAGIEKLIGAKTLNRLFPRFYWDENQTTEVDFLHGCCMLIRRDAIEAIGVFTEDYFMYFEEQDWCYRARKLGCQIWYQPAATAIHYGAASPLDNRSEVFNRSMLIFYRRNIGTARGLLITALQIGAACISLVRATIAPRNEKDLDAIRSYLSQRMGLFRGLIGSGKAAS
ncbi:MAG: glycosyltransferase family 2 protein [Thermodesulfovibrionales bacterium]